jgi:hypothetical protein
MVEQVKELRSEVQTHVLPGQNKLFDNGKIRVYETGAVNRQSRCVAKVTNRLSESTRVNRETSVAQMIWGFATL